MERKRKSIDRKRGVGGKRGRFWRGAQWRELRHWNRVNAFLSIINNRWELGTAIKIYIDLRDDTLKINERIISAFFTRMNGKAKNHNLKTQQAIDQSPVYLRLLLRSIYTRTTSSVRMRTESEILRRVGLPTEDD